MLSADSDELDSRAEQLTMSIPHRLFKYVAFSDRVLEQLYTGQVFFSDPATFNDPLDCQPIVEPDEPTDQLKLLLAELVLRRTQKEIDAAMKMLKLRGPKVAQRRQALGESAVKALLGEIEYQATDPDVEDPETHVRASLAYAIQTEIRKAYDKGVLCLCASWNSPLMWSHYAEQHRGLCIEYDVSNVPPGTVRSVAYDESRVIRSSIVRTWLLNDDPGARAEIERACLLTKSKEWQYESEFRILDAIGLRSSPADVMTITFGLRCSLERQYTLIKSLQGNDGIEFFEISAPGPRFELHRNPVNCDEVLHSMPLRSVLLDFDLHPVNQVKDPADQINP